VFVKICGITNEEDALMAVALGADAVGFVFAPSPRQVTVGTVRDIVKRLPPEVISIGVFRDQPPEWVSHTVLEAGLTGAQLHGHETPREAAEVRQHAKVLIMAFPAGDPGLAHLDDFHADAVLLDAHVPGSGRPFDWSLAESIPLGRRVILAGGLSSRNVAEGIATVHPWGVDVSSGVEVRNDPTRKDPLKVHAFIKAVREADPTPFSLDAAGEVHGRPLGREPFDWAEQGD
jgi:phosphoribosylanthranilate isomerase